MRVLLLAFVSLLFITCGSDKSTTDSSAVSSTKAQSSNGPLPQFKLLNSANTHVDFNNKLNDDPLGDRNVMSYQHYYNGAGVGIADFDNDGLQDLFFAGNEVDNRLYLNKGNMVFEDITKMAGVNENKNWAAGVSIVDINNDGYKDIYVSQQGPYSDSKDKENLLYLNNGDLTFTEVAKSMGLNDGNQSTQAVFFDYDKDGDLDCYVLNESPYAGKSLAFIFKELKNKENLIKSSGHLYRNDKSKFTRVTEQAGMLKNGFGLGVAVSDINNDGYPDLYVANDYSVPDYLFINQKDGTFKESVKEYTKQISFYSMGCDIADFNNDGLVDISVVDMAADDHFRSKTLMANMDVDQLRHFTKNLGYQNQFMFNSLQLNTGKGGFSNVANYCNFSNSDWSWATLMHDVDLDGDKDIFVSNGFRRYSRDNDFRNEMKAIRAKHNGKVPDDLKIEIYNRIPTVQLPNRLYVNNGDLKFEEIAEQVGLEKNTYSYGSAFGDLDNDGDADLVINNVDQEAMIYQNAASNNANFIKVKLSNNNKPTAGAKVTIKTAEGNQFQEYYFVRGYESCMEDVLFFGLGQQESVSEIQVIWPDNNLQVVKPNKINETLTINYAVGKIHNYSDSQPTALFEEITASASGINYVHKENDFDDFAKEILLPHMQSTLGPALATADVNGDGLEDFYIGGAFGTTGQVYLQTSDGKFKPNGAEPWNLDIYNEDMDAVFFDANGDNNPELLVLSGGGGDMEGKPVLLNDRFYANLGNGKFGKIKNAMPEISMVSSCQALTDFDGDGDQDLFIGGGAKPGQYPSAETSRFLRYEKNRFIDATEEVLPNAGNIGMIKSAQWVDLNGDGKQDLVLAGEWTGIKIFVSENGKLVDKSSEYGTDKMMGWWYNITVSDFDNDGDMDILAGNIGSNYKHKVSEKKPLYLYYNDFDNNGVGDIVLCKEYKNELVPARGRQCSSEQMPFIKDKFPTFKAFASANIADIYGKDKLDDSNKLTATTFRSVILENKNGKYTERQLPALANISPMLTATVLDVNSDGHSDIISAGNIFNTELETPSLDAGNGLVMLGDGKLNFKPLSVAESGIEIPNNVKKIKLLKSNQSQYLIAANNNNKVQLFKLK